MNDLKTIFEKINTMYGILMLYDHKRTNKNITKKELESVISQIDWQIHWITRLENYDKLEKFAQTL